QYKPNREIFHHIHLLDEESSTSFSLIVSTVCDHCKDVLSRIQGDINKMQSEFAGNYSART
ncbi:hypothetical protein, partial [Anoxybacillus flavithermus]|uniref:hypothetical protein n=1 Tax=Anoxybacillus flavithermus TaxID=33934 RepID=UPI00196A2CB2